ncbi:MAG: hypothetical protein K5989_11730 [Lachnospiraceae bacterium]|nr:hypothetical protein [Lachnospiraceae bacterium]
MSFLSIPFFIFITIVILLLQLIRNINGKRYLLLLASYVFYGFFDLRFPVLLFLLSVFTWAIGCRIGSLKDLGRDAAAKRVAGIGIACQIAVLAFFKYFNSFQEFFFRKTAGDGGFLRIAIPVGLSFYLLQAVSYLIDLSRGRLEKSSPLSKVMLYVGFFPQLVSGPIVKAHDFLPQLEHPEPLTRARLSYGLQLFLLGALNKLVFADRLAVAVDSVYSAPAAYSGMSLFIASLGYTLQIYFDFASYSDMAIGVGYILGFDLGQNFNLPYLARNPSDFWRRWHISLSSYLRDYVYISLGGNRKGKIRTYINLFLTMVVSGLWHGSTLNFLFWGMFHGLALIVHRIYSRELIGRGKAKALSTGAENGGLRVNAADGSLATGSENGELSVKAADGSLATGAENGAFSVKATNDSLASGAENGGLSVKASNDGLAKATANDSFSLGSVLAAFLSITLNFLLVSFLWIPFRAETLSDTLLILKGIFTMQPGIVYYYVYTLIFLGILLAVQIYAAIRSNSKSPWKPFELRGFWGKFFICMEILAIFMFANFGNSAFIYSQF